MGVIFIMDFWPYLDGSGVKWFCSHTPKKNAARGVAKKITKLVDSMVDATGMNNNSSSFVAGGSRKKHWPLLFIVPLCHVVPSVCFGRICLQHYIHALFMFCFMLSPYQKVGFHHNRNIIR